MTTVQLIYKGDSTQSHDQRTMPVSLQATNKIVSSVQKLQPPVE